jgi:hypothetical protein
VLGARYPVSSKPNRADQALAAAPIGATDTAHCVASWVIRSTLELAVELGQTTDSTVREEIRVQFELRLQAKMCRLRAEAAHEQAAMEARTKAAAELVGVMSFGVARLPGDGTDGGRESKARQMVMKSVLRAQEEAAAAKTTQPGMVVSPESRRTDVAVGGFGGRLAEEQLYASSPEKRKSDVKARMSRMLFLAGVPGFRSPTSSPTSSPRRVGSALALSGTTSPTICNTTLTTKLAAAAGDGGDGGGSGSDAFSPRVGGLAKREVKSPLVAGTRLNTPASGSDGEEYGHEHEHGHEHGHKNEHGREQEGDFEANDEEAEDEDDEEELPALPPPSWQQRTVAETHGVSMVSASTPITYEADANERGEEEDNQGSQTEELPAMPFGDGMFMNELKLRLKPQKD